MSIVVALLVGMLIGWAVRHGSAQLDDVLADARRHDDAWQAQLDEIAALPEVQK